MKRKLLLISFFAGLASLGGCAVAPMTSETYARLLELDSSKISSAPACCKDWREVDFRRELTLQGIDLSFGSNSQIRDFGTYRSPVAGLKLSGNTGQSDIEIFSFSDARHGAMRFDDRLFVRPDLVFLDADFQVVNVVSDPLMCWGSKDQSGGVWFHHAIPAGAAFVVLSPSTRKPMQAVDTRTLGYIPPGIQAISDARGKTYISNVSMGYTGLISVRAVRPNAPPLGRCVEPPTS